MILMSSHTRLILNRLSRSQKLSGTILGWVSGSEKKTDQLLSSLRNICYISFITTKRHVVWHKVSHIFKTSKSYSGIFCLYKDNQLVYSCWSSFLLVQWLFLYINRMCTRLVMFSGYCDHTGLGSENVVSETK